MNKENHTLQIETWNDGRLNNSVGEFNKLAKFNANDILMIRKSEKTITELSKELNVSLAILSRIKSFKSYKNVI